MSEANTPAAEAPAPAPESAAEAAPVTPVAEASPLGVQPAEGAPEGEPVAEGEAAHEGEPASPEAEVAESADLTPESYTFTLPEGVSADETTMTALKQTLADNKVPVEAGQALIDMHIAELNRSAEAFAKSQTDAWNATTAEWKAQIDADPELGGDNKAVVTTAIARALDDYGTPETRAAFDLTGSGWNPAIIKFIYKMASALGEGSPHGAPGPSSNRTRTPGQILYPDAPQS